MQKKYLSLLVVLLLALAACGPRYNPQTGMYTVYGVAKFKMPSGYTEVGSTSVNVLPYTYITGAFPYQAFSTTMFRNGESYIFSQVLTLPGRRFFIRPLLGSKVSKWGGGWREGNYQLTTASPTYEFKEYFDFLRRKGAPLASAYQVTMYDRLIGRRAIARVVFLTPTQANGFGSVPTAKDLYILERDDFR